MTETRFRGWEYAKRGDYHKNLDPNWPFAPTYYRKIEEAEKFIQSLPPEAKILDAGCGEGVLTEKYKNAGRHITGVDLNYESDLVIKGDVLALPFADNTFDAVLFMDVLEHLGFKELDNALGEIKRTLKPGGRLFLTIPNMANLSSRLRLLFRGELHRSDSVQNHLSERPLKENMAQLQNNAFEIKKIKGITLTVPFLYTKLITGNPSRYLWLHNLLEKAAIPGLSLLNVIICVNKK